MFTKSLVAGTFKWKDGRVEFQGPIRCIFIKVLLNCQRMYSYIRRESDFIKRSSKVYLVSFVFKYFTKRTFFFGVLRANLFMIIIYTGNKMYTISIIKNMIGRI